MKSALVFAVLFSQSVHSSVDLKPADLKSKIDNERRLLVESEIKRRGVLGALYEINKDLGKVDQDIATIEKQMNDARRSIESYAKIVARLEKIRDREKILLRERLRAFYKIGLEGYAEVLLSSQTSGDFVRNLKFFKIVTERNSQLIANYKNNVDMLEKETRKLKGQVRIYARFEAELSEQKKKYAEQKARQLFLLSEIDHDRDSHVQAVKEWRDAARKLEEKYEKLGVQDQTPSEITRGTFFEQKGLLKPPVAGEIIQRYGIIHNKRFNTKIFHKGLFFSANPGSKVSSVFWGKIAFAGWLDGYGETIIVDHGDHYYSLYAHNSHLDKQVGQTVNSGEAIAEAGDSASLRGPGVYMEIRHFSESLDPFPWLDLGHSSRL